MRALLVAALGGVHAWEECAFPTFDHFLIDEGAGKSYSYTVALMNGKSYVGGYAQGTFFLQGVNETDDSPPANDAALFGKPHSKLVTLYVAEASSEGKHEKSWYFPTDQSSASNNKIIVRGLHSVLTNTHVVAAGYLDKGATMTLPDGTVVTQPAPRAAGFVAKLDVNSANGVGEGTSGWFKWLSAGAFAGGADIYSVDGDKNGDIIVSHKGCTGWNTTSEEPLGCKYYVAKLRSDNGNVLWTTEVPAQVDPVRVTQEGCPTGGDGGCIFAAFKCDKNKTYTFTSSIGFTATSNAVGVVKMHNAGAVLWAKQTLAASSAGELSVNKDGTLLAVAGSDLAGSSYRTGVPGQIARIDTSVGNEGNVMWVDSSGVGSHGVRDVIVTWDPAADVQQVLGFGQIQGSETLTDVNGATTTLRSRGSYEVFIVSYNPDGSGRWAADGGGSGLEYFFDISMDMLTEEIAVGGGVGYSASTLDWGNVHRDNVMYCEGSSTPVGDMKAFAVKLKTELSLPTCLQSCSNDAKLVKSDVKANHCYIDRYCYAHGESAPYAGAECFACDTAKPLEWTGPDVTAHCHIDGVCQAKGAEKRGMKCMTCQPAKSTTAWSLMDGWKTVVQTDEDGDEETVCKEITWEEKANANGWVPCVTRRLRMLKEAVVAKWTGSGSRRSLSVLPSGPTEKKRRALLQSEVLASWKDDDDNREVEL
jgi:hypothetical protein